MATSSRDLCIGLYREHLDEASFLYAQRKAYLQDREVLWGALHEWEDRFETHIDALVLGGSAALAFCRQAAPSEAGELYAALSVLCRENEKQEAFATLGRIDPADKAACEACADALCREAPTEWQRDLIAALADDRQPHTGLLARVIGYRRLTAAEETLGRKLSHKATSGRADLAWALGRLGGDASIPALWPLLDDPDEWVRESAALALLRLGDSSPLRPAMAHAADQPWTRRVIGLSGPPQAVDVLLETLQRNGPDRDTLLALGLLGDLAAVSPLLLALEGDQSEAAAVALNTITGASLYASVFIPDVVDVDELDPEERKANDGEGRPPTQGERPFGIWERRALSDRGGWRAWLDQNKHRFNRDSRWREGKPYGPRALLECLRVGTSPFVVRQACYEELVIRYRLDVPFEVDLPVRQQLRFLDRIESWVSRQASRFVDGQWYLKGEPQA